MTTACADPWAPVEIETACQKCGTPVLWKTIGAMQDEPVGEVQCETCYEADRARRAAAAAEAERTQVFGRTGIPEEFAEFRRDLAWNFGQLLSWVRQHRMESLFVGSKTSGITKTRSTAYAALELAREGEDVRWILSTEWLRKTCLMMGDDSRRAEARIDAVKRCRLLVIDDLGTEIPTARAAEIIWEIIDSRTRSKYRRTWITSNYAGSELAARLGAVGAKTMRRLQDVCTVWTPGK